MRTTVLNFNFKNKSRTTLKAAYSGSPRTDNLSRRRMRALEQCCPPRTMYLFSAASRCHTSTRIFWRVQPHRLKPLQHPLLSQWSRLAVLCAKVEMWQVQGHCMGGDEYPVSLNWPVHAAGVIGDGLRWIHMCVHVVVSTTWVHWCSQVHPVLVLKDNIAGIHDGR